MKDPDINSVPKSLSEARAAGSKFYFTGNVCPQGHIGLRSTSSGGCVACLRARALARHNLNRDENLERHRDWNRANRDVNSKSNREWRKNNRHKVCAAKSEWAKSHRSSINEYGRRWYAANCEKERERGRKRREINLEAERRRGREYYRKNPHVVRAADRRRRARKLLAEGWHSNHDIELIRKGQKDRCAYCCERLRGKGHVDHIQPLSRGGSDWPKNLQLLCQSCNQSKNARDPLLFARTRGMLL